MDIQDTNAELQWRDTYFILFRASQRPTLTQVEATLSSATQNVALKNLEADEDGMFESILVQAPVDNAALEISYESGEAVLEQCTQLADQLKADEDIQPEQLAALLEADARLDVMLFEQVSTDGLLDENEDDMLPDTLDPASLLTVVEALAKLTGGLPIDPASGAVMM